MATTVVRGPFLPIVDKTGSSTPSSVPAWQNTRYTNSTKRVRPTNPLTSPTGLTKYREHQILPQGVYRNANDGSYTQSPSGFVAQDYGVDQALYDSTRREAVMRVRTKVKDEDWNLSTFLGELPQTIKYFSEYLKSIVNLFRAVRRGRMKEVRRLIKKNRNSWSGRHAELSQGKAADRWLEWRYAIMPLTYDLGDMLKALSRSGLRLPIMRASGGARGVHRSRVENLSYTRVQLAEWQDRIVMYYSVSPNVQAFKRLGLLNPLATLYELTPLSFVLDWLIPLGRFIGSLDAMAGVSVLSSTWSQSQVKQERYVSKIVNGSFFTESAWDRNSYVRTPSADLSLPLPRFQLSLNSSRFLDSLALTRKILLS